MGKKITFVLEENPVYDIIIEKNFNKLTDAVKALSIVNRKLCIVTDTNVEKLYAQTVKTELEKTGNAVFLFTFTAGESNKTLSTVTDLYEYLIVNRFDRKDLLVALGGGVVGDLAGFAAATYLRGIDYIQIPTSLLAQVDSSVGGKTGVDFKSYKNMVGAFLQPRLVYMSLETLKSLDRRLFNSGLGEIIKHGLILDEEYYHWLQEHYTFIQDLEYDVLEEMIYRSCRIKCDVVQNDPTEQGARALLNFGHTLGHAIEKLTNFKYYHGECVVLGMIASLEISRNRGYLSDADLCEALELFRSYDFFMTVSRISGEDIIAVSKSDKKMDSGKIKFILLKNIGKAYIDTTVTEQEMSNALQKVISLS